ncbi:hypothetical protein [Nocardioides bizhenqiangii]|uniref:VIT family protein n=1 Tax=Nocardioides bizhenqiangii TaxID=3095076 RepID=A0ABZ0ZUP1_9ACTN|nr:hypothetical protein [Nocardioides sp. HM61]WQQ28042.1 hypothetical protein SHK19_07365 [Nocardioides sp. HM61]
MAGERTALATWWSAGLMSHLRSGQVARVVYGSIVGLALVLTMEAHPPEEGRVAAALVATGLAVGLAELYSELIGLRARAGAGEEVGPLRIVIGDTVAVILGVAFPAVFFFASTAGLIETDTAFALAKWTGLGLIGAYSFLAARLTGAGHARSLVHAGGAAVIAAALIAFKALIH